MVEESKKINHWIQSPNSMTWDDVLWLENLVRRFPFFQSAHALIAKHYLSADHILKTKKVSTAATYSLNRQELRNFLLKEKESSPSKTDIKQHNPQETRSANDFILPAMEVEEKTPTAPLPDPTIQNETIAEFTPSNHANLGVTENTDPNHTAPTDQYFGERQTDRGSQPSSGETDSKKENLLGAINKRLEELNALKKERADQKIKERQAEKKSKETLETNTEAEKQTNWSTPETTPQENQNTFGSSLRQSTEQDASIEFDKRQAQASIQPKEIYDSELGNVLLQEEGNDLDNLLTYIQRQKAKKLAPKPDINKVDQIVSRFIQEDPKMPKLKAGSEAKVINKKRTNPKLISENLAIINAQQGNETAAIEIYEELSLKYPEKKAYFTSQINKLRKK